MATTHVSSFLWVIILFSGFVCPHAHEGGETAESHDFLHTHTVQVSSLIPSTTCTSTASNDEGPKSKGSLKVIHKYGPCFQSNKEDKVAVPNHIEILLQDLSRVNSIHSRLSKSSGNSKFRDSQAATLPAKSGLTVGSGNYVVTVGLGTPKRDLRLVFDTGSDLTWTQCEPCAGYCYKQVDSIFDPSKSTSYSNITCTSPTCTQLTSVTGNRPRCSSTSQCIYLIGYGDKSYSIGYFSKERLTITSSDVLDNFLFGCGQDNEGLFKGFAGLLGLGRNKISIVQQAAQKYGIFFSYCLPSTPSSTGHLTFGNGGGVSNNVKFTPLVTISRDASFYGLGLTGISVGGRQLSIPTSVFSAPGTIIDSGTVITRLPPMAYNELRTAIRESMRGYPLTSPVSILDTCYDFSKNKSVLIPSIGFLFGGVSVDLDPTGVFYMLSSSKACLGFTGNSDASNIVIIGNTQQKRLEVVHDIAGGRIGFGPSGCS